MNTVIFGIGNLDLIGILDFDIWIYNRGLSAYE